MANSKKMGMAIGALSLVAVAAAGFYFYSTHERDAAKAVFARKAPRFEAKDVQGKTHRLEELSGNLVVLHFWAAWCPPCVDEIPRWVAASKKWANHPVKFLAVSLDSNWQEAEKIFPQKDLPPNLISLLDTSGKVPEEYGSYQFPETYLLNERLEIVTKWVGPQEWDGEAMSALIERALPKKTP